MKILIIGNGGREHTLTWKINQSPKVSKIYVAPGNAGTATLAENVNIAVDDLEGLLSFAKEKQIDLTIVGPELPLTLGITDLFQNAGLKVFGPSEKGAVLEASKVFTKDFCLRHNIPTATYKKFKEASEAEAYAKEVELPIVVKADGIAAGKGVYLCHERKDVVTAVDEIMVQKIFGDSGNEVVFEQFLVGEEVSILCFVDGKTVVPMETARDHKQVFDGNKGPNTGGMGVYSPAHLISEKIFNEIMEDIIKPSVAAMAEEGREFKGILFAGLMLDKNVPYLLEYNCRFGDPECQAVLTRLENDLIDIMLAVIDGTLDKIEVKWSNQASVCVVMAAGGYPGSYKKGDVISGLEDVDDAIVFHAGTKLNNGNVVTAGGRVLGVTALGDTQAEARTKAYANVKKISWNGAFCRTDIGATE